VLQRNNQTVYLLTNVFDDKRLSGKEAGVLYEMRWGVEVFYRSYKQTLSRRRLLSRTPATCLAECQWTMLGLWLLGLMTVERLIMKGVDPQCWSVAKARNAVRCAMQVGCSRTRCGRLLGELAKSTKDVYERRGRKGARNYPRKKREKPPGPPKLQSASLQEIQRAKRLQTRIRRAA